MWPWVTKKVLKWKKTQKNILFYSKLILSTFLWKGKPERSCCRCIQFDIGVTICAWWLATLLYKSGKGFKIFSQCWTTFPIWQVSNWIFYRENTKQKHHFYRVADTIKVCVFSSLLKIQFVWNSSDAVAVILTQQIPVLVSAHAQNFSWSSVNKCLQGNAKGNRTIGDLRYRKKALSVLAQLILPP